jgi:N-acetylneuraminic acid mutarotase
MIRTCAFFLLVSCSPQTAFGEGPAGAIQDIRWSLGPEMPELRKGGCATVLNGQVISAFGMRYPWGEMETVYVFDPLTKSWRRAADAPVGQCYVQGTECGSAFYSIGGRGALQQGKVHRACFRLTTRADEYQWQRIVDLTEARAWAPSASIGTKLFVFGGSQGGHGPTLSSVEMLDTAAKTPSWIKVADLPGKTRGWSGAASAGGKLYHLGGAHFFTPRPESGPDRERTKEVWKMDPETYEWTACRPLPVRLSGFDCCTFGDRYIIVVGGAHEDADLTPVMRAAQRKDPSFSSYYCPFVFVYDTQRDSWRLLSSLLPKPTNDIRVVISGRQLYAIGGENIDPATSNTTRYLRIGELITK